jgi:hypothetical protein
MRLYINIETHVDVNDDLFFQAAKEQMEEERAAFKETKMEHLDAGYVQVGDVFWRLFEEGKIKIKVDEDYTDIDVLDGNEEISEEDIQNKKKIF